MEEENYTETSEVIGDEIYNLILPEQFSNSDIPDNEYSFVPIDDNFLCVKNVECVSDGTLTTIPLGTTIRSREQILSVIVAGISTPMTGFIIPPDFYKLNSSKNAIVLLSGSPMAANQKFYVKFLDGLFFSGIRKGA